MRRKSSTRISEIGSGTIPTHDFVFLGFSGSYPDEKLRTKARWRPKDSHDYTTKKKHGSRIGKKKKKKKKKRGKESVKKKKKFKFLIFFFKKIKNFFFFF